MTKTETKKRKTISRKKLKIILKTEGSQSKISNESDELGLDIDDEQTSLDVKLMDINMREERDFS